MFCGEIRLKMSQEAINGLAEETKPEQGRPCSNEYERTWFMIGKHRSLALEMNFVEHGKLSIFG